MTADSAPTKSADATTASSDAGIHSAQTIGPGKVVELEYTLSLEDGEVAASSENGGSLIYLQGKEEIFEPVEEALTGRTVGAEINLTLSPEDAFGEETEELVDIPRAELDGNKDTIEIGDEIALSDEDGDVIVGVVCEANDETVSLDLDHPLAGETIVFVGKVISVRDATAHELEHGTEMPDDELAAAIDAQAN